MGYESRYRIKLLPRDTGLCNTFWDILSWAGLAGPQKEDKVQIEEGHFICDIDPNTLKCMDYSRCSSQPEPNTPKETITQENFDGVLERMMDSLMRMDYSHCSKLDIFSGERQADCVHSSGGSISGSGPFTQTLNEAHRDILSRVLKNGRTIEQVIAHVNTRVNTEE